MGIVYAIIDRYKRWTFWLKVRPMGSNRGKTWAEVKEDLGLELYP